MMVGYPQGLSDDINNYPIFRKGITATHPFIDYRGKKEFLVDIACFPGSSGSPIFMLDTSHTDERGNVRSGTERFVFLGVLCALERIPSTENIITHMHYMHLGYAIKSSEVINLINEIN